MELEDESNEKSKHEASTQFSETEKNNVTDLQKHSEHIATFCLSLAATVQNMTLIQRKVFCPSSAWITRDSDTSDQEVVCTFHVWRCSVEQILNFLAQTKGFDFSWKPTRLRTRKFFFQMNSLLVQKISTTLKFLHLKPF